MPTCPRHLDRQAKKEWKRAGKILDTIGLLSELDMAVFAAYCISYSKWVDACNESNAIKLIDIGKKLDPQKYGSRVVEFHTEYQTWIFATNDIIENGIIIVNKDGIPGRNKILGLQREAGDRMAKIRKSIEKNLHDRHEEMHKNMTQIGLSPSNRASLKIEKPKGKSKAERFRDRKRGVK